MVRILLLLLLPAIVVVIYLEGQKYDPAILEFESIEKTATTSIFPVDIEGYDRTGRVRVFTRDNLYEYVNGHAEYFISAGFVSLVVVEYRKAGSGSPDPDVVVEIYDIGRDIQAFGVLADEAGSSELGSEAGSMSFRTGRGLSFISGKFYVRLNVYSDTAPLLEFARQIEDRIGGGSELDALFSGFPDLGAPINTRFIREAYRGLDFLHDVMEREYSIGGDHVYVFMVEGEGDEIAGLVADFFNYFRESGILYEVLEGGGGSFYQVFDPYEGEWILLPMNDRLYGIFGATGPGIVNEFLEKSRG